MKRMHRLSMYIIQLCVGFVCTIETVHAMNLLKPYDVLIRPDYDNKNPFQFFLLSETGVSNVNFNSDGDRVDALQIWNKDVNGLKMLEGFNPTSQIGQKRIRIDANDDGVRGHLNVCSDFNMKFGGAFATRYFFHNNWSLSAYLPFYSLELKDVKFQDQTPSINDADIRVKELLTNDFANNVKELGNVDITGWNRSGIGDITLMLEWFNDFEQTKQFLHNVRVYWRAGLSLPSGKRWDENLLFAVPFGNDGAFALPFGIGLDLTFGNYVRVGGDVLLTHIFGNKRCRRIKTAVDQTDLILLQTAQVFKDFGLNQQFSLWGELHKFYAGLSFKFGYEFFKHGQDAVSLSSNAFSSEIANDAEHLEDFTVHQIITNLSYDCTLHFDDDAPVVPRINLFARLPFNGKRAAAFRTIGVGIAIDF